MRTMEIPHEQWQPFLDQFSKQHQGECVTVEVLEGEGGMHAVASQSRLIGITDDPKNSEGEMIEVMIGDSPDSLTNHDIRQPCCLRVAQSDDGSDVAVEIESNAMPKTIVRFSGPEWPTEYGPRSGECQA